ncbi:hypothetical protein BO94DRAFT_535046 [Aspergillus sclerotioniger CBS 115572]|uniref:Uncharacterized protein n=1 Tax=Aspergillus sclerotioniger CBS 115572 TaxID=1450535 RepID=A0A317WSB8_9EURO|nr:hypothetical protein BO94DRAFT_535046 [Aspergillus sclerotioniger CBS 115572]PWY88037.1 hypothetical protein BO94DRAFT_535046 [Aspergillus sclerotioniger CBS 115572]
MSKPNPTHHTAYYLSPTTKPTTSTTTPTTLIPSEKQYIHLPLFKNPTPPTSPSPAPNPKSQTPRQTPTCDPSNPRRIHPSFNRHNPRPSTIGRGSPSPGY